MSYPNGRTDTDRVLDRIAADLERIGNHVDDIAAFSMRMAGALERLADAIAPRPVAVHTAAVSAALDVATDTDDPEADALLDAAMNELNAWPR